MATTADLIRFLQAKDPAGDRVVVHADITLAPREMLFGGDDPDDGEIVFEDENKPVRPHLFLV